MAKYSCAAPGCVKRFQPNLPGIDRSEAPYYQYVDSDGETRFLCSDGCMAEFLERVRQHSTP